MTYSGLWTALITPFQDDRLDETGLRLLIRRQLSAHVDGIVLLGTTGESSTLSAQEKERILRIAREEAPSLPLMAGTGSPCTRTVIEWTQRAAEWGADSALVVSPYYNKPTAEGLFLHFHTIARHSPIPLMVYNSSRTGVNITTPLLQRLMEIPQIVGIKESSGLIDQGSEMASLCSSRPDFNFLAGDDALALPLIALGGRGLISVASNLIPKRMAELVKLCLDGEFSKGRILHHSLLPLFKMLFCETNPIPIKAAHSLCGLPAGEPRMPLTPISQKNKESLQGIPIQLQELEFRLRQNSNS